MRWASSSGVRCQRFQVAGALRGVDEQREQRDAFRGVAVQADGRCQSLPREGEGEFLARDGVRHRDLDGRLV